MLNGIADEYFRRRLSDGERQELRKQFGVNADDTLIIFCGRLIYEKGVKEIINGVIGTDNHTMKLMIVGGSNFEDSSLTKYVKEVQELAKEHSDQVFLSDTYQIMNCFSTIRWRTYKLFAQYVKKRRGW